MLDIAYRRLNLDFIKFFNKNKNKLKKEKKEKESSNIIKKEKLVKDKAILEEKKNIKEKLDEEIKVEKEKTKEFKKPKNEEAQKDNQKDSLDTSALLKKKSDRKKIQKRWVSHLFYIFLDIDNNIIYKFKISL